MDVIYDSEIFALQEHGGVSRLFSELIREFVSNPEHDINPILSFSRTNNSYLNQLANEKLIKSMKPLGKYLIPNSPLRTLLTLGLTHDLNLSYAARSRSINSKLLHATYYRPTRIESRAKDSLVVTVHDFIPERLGWNWVKNPHYGKKKLISRAKLVVCVSKTTEKDLINFYGNIDLPKILVPHGVREVSTLEEKLSSKSSRPYLLYVGHRAGYKSFETLSRAMQILSERNEDIELISVGPDLTAEEKIQNEKLLVNLKWRNLGQVSDFELKSLYKNAHMTCITSTMEGFGLPIIESLAEGTSVLASRIPVFQEVGDSSVTYFEPANAESLADAISQEMQIAFERNKIQLRLNRASRFTWSIAATRMAKAYKTLT